MVEQIIGASTPAPERRFGGRVNPSRSTGYSHTMEGNAQQVRAGQPWGRVVFGLGAVAVGLGDALFVRTGAGGDELAWTAYFGTYLALLAVAAASAAVTSGRVQAGSAAATAGGTLAVNLVMLASIGIFLVPVTVVMFIAATHRGTGSELRPPVALATGAVLTVLPFVGLILFYH